MFVSMDWMQKLEKRFGGWAIPNLTIYLLIMQSVGVALLMGGHNGALDFVLHGNSVMKQGEWWRLLSFMMVPKTLSPIWLFFAFYIFYMMGSSLEREWGTFRFNLFILCGYLFTVAMAFVNPGVVITNTYFLGCVFLAFATLFPNIEFRLFFILPVKVKWLGWLTVGFYIMTLLSADPGSRLCVVAAFANYLLFFGKDIAANAKAGQRRKKFIAERVVDAEKPFHTCAECGITDKTNPEAEFRYCSTCNRCFCSDHLQSHEHAN